MGKNEFKSKKELTDFLLDKWYYEQLQGNVEKSESCFSISEYLEDIEKRPNKKSKKNRGQRIFGDIKSDADNVKEDVEIDYFYKNDYVIYEKNFKYDDCQFLEPDELFFVDLNILELDCFCKKRIMYYKNNTNYIDKKSKKYSYLSPYKLRGEGFIKSGRYSDWKAFVLESFMADAMGLDRRRYILKNVDRLLEHTAFVLLLLNRCIKICKVTKSIFIWDCVEKALNAYKKNVCTVELTKEDKGRITEILVGKAIYDYKMKYTKDDYDEEGVLKDKWEMLSINQKEKIKNLECELNDAVERISLKQEEKSTFDDQFQNINVDDRHIYFAVYLAPIAAAICQHYEENPFLRTKTIWTSQIDRQNVYWKEGGKDFKTLVNDYSIFIAYLDYLENIEDIVVDDIFVERYEIFCNLMLNKIREKNKLAEDERYVQYYVVEQMLGMQFISEITKVIKEKIQNGRVIEILNTNYLELGEIISCLYRCKGVLSKIGFAKRVLERYFEKIEKNKNEDMISCLELKHRIYVYNDRYIEVERSYVDILQKCRIYGKQKDEQDSSYRKDVDKKLEEYINKMEWIESLVNDKEICNKNGDLSVLNIKKKSIEVLNGYDANEKAIKKWVMKNIFEKVNFLEVSFKNIDL